MTRDDAVKKAEECFQFNVPSQEWFFTPLRLVAALEHLGVLKLEEPKSRMTRLFEELNWREGGVSYQMFFEALDKAGLKLVERTPQESE